MYTLNYRVNHVISQFHVRIVFTLFFTLGCINFVEAKSYDLEVLENKIESLEEDVDTKTNKESVKIYVLEGTVIHNLKNNNSEIVYVKEKFIANKKAFKHNKKRKKEKGKLKARVDNKTITNEFQFIGKKRSPSAFYEMVNGIKSVIPTSASSFKATLPKDYLKQKSVFFLSNYTADKKQQFPFYLFVAKPSFHLAMAVRPPPFLA